MAEHDGRITSSRIELVSDATIRMALVGPRASGKTLIAKALMPSVEAAGRGSYESLAQADVVLYVHDLQQHCLNKEESSDIKLIDMTVRAHKQAALAVIGTHRDCLSPDCGNEAINWLAATVNSAVGHELPIFGVSGSLWTLSRRESECGREIAACCFQESSGIVPVLEWIESIRWRSQSRISEIVDQVANKVACILARRLTGTKRDDSL